MAGILVILGILAILALVWAAIESRKPREEVGAGMPSAQAASESSPEESMRQAFLAARGLKPREWESMRDDVVFVHDGLSDPELVPLLVRIRGYDARQPFGAELTSGDEGESGESEEEPITPAARERFRAELGARGLTERVEPLGTFYAPGPFDAYRIRERA